MELFRSAHRRMMETLEGLSDADLYRPYASYVLDREDVRQEPVIYWILGNTSEHFEEHRAYIQALAAMS